MHPQSGNAGKPLSTGAAGPAWEPRDGGTRSALSHEPAASPFHLVPASAHSPCPKQASPHPLSAPCCSVCSVTTPPNPLTASRLSSDSLCINHPPARCPPVGGRLHVNSASLGLTGKPASTAMPLVLITVDDVDNFPKSQLGG